MKEEPDEFKVTEPTRAFTILILLQYFFFHGYDPYINTNTSFTSSSLNVLLVKLLHLSIS